MFRNRELAITPFYEDCFLISSEGEVQIVVNPLPKPKFTTYNKKLAEVISMSGCPIVLLKETKEVINTWEENLIMIPGDRQESGNIIPVKHDKLFNLKPEYAISFPSSEKDAPFLIIKALNMHMMYVSSPALVDSPPLVDVLLAPRSLLREAREQVRDIRRIPQYLACEPETVVTRSREHSKEQIELQGLHELPPGHSLRIMRHLASVTVLGRETNLSEVLPMLKIV